ncbi:unnamed protein product, partial [Cyprideis torosa]
KGRAMSLAEEFNLRWKNHLNTISQLLGKFLNDKSLCDVILSAEGQTISCHRVMLAACSTYFQEIFNQVKDKALVVMVKDAKFIDLKSLVDFMYYGEVSVEHDRLNSLLRTAASLKVKGLADEKKEKLILSEPPIPVNVPSEAKFVGEPVAKKQRKEPEVEHEVDDSDFDIKSHEITMTRKFRDEWMADSRFRTWISIAGIAGCSVYFLRQNDWDATTLGFVRVARAAAAITSIALDYRLTIYSNHGLNVESPEYIAMRSNVHKRSADRLLNMCRRNGGVYIKVGQHVAAMEHLLPDEFVDTMKSLQSGAPESSMEE